MLEFLSVVVVKQNQRMVIFGNLNKILNLIKNLIWQNKL